MSRAIRFLAVAVIGWGAMRAATLGIIPGSDMFVARSEAAVPPVASTQLPSIESLPDYPVWDAYGAEPYFAGPPTRSAAPQVYYVSVPQGSPPPMQTAQAYTPILPFPSSTPLFGGSISSPDDWQLSRLASTALPSRRSTAAASSVASAAPVSKPRLDRLQLTAWALLRNRPGGDSLASGGMLGGSQAGARLTYNVTRQIAASVRTSSPTDSPTGAEAAAGVRLTPFRSIPLSVTAERRQGLGRYGGRSAFAVFVEGGRYQQPLPWRFQLDSYVQGGIVGARRRDLFIDGGFTFTRPIYGRYSAGFGLWGAAQPGVYRVDAGPRVSMRVRDNVRVHLDWRQRLFGNATPPSGPAVTLAGDF